MNIVSVALLAVSLCVAALPSAAADSIVLDWSAHVQKALAPTSGVARSRADVLAHIAMFNALNAVETRYAFYGPALERAADASPDIALATAALGIVETLPGAQLDDMRKALADAMSKVPDAGARARGVEVGRIAAARLLLLRASDVTERIDAVPAAPGRGVWQRPDYSKRAPNLAITRMRPMAIVDVAAFDPGPPPDVESAAAARDLAEVRMLGGRTSTARTVEQALVVAFWSANAEGFDHALLRNIAEARKVSDLETARMLALISMASFDVEIVVATAKVRYQYWRPVEAIAGPFANAGVRDPQWAPLLRTPASPDWPSGGGSGAGLYETLLSAFAQGTAVEWSVFVDENGMTRSWADPKAMADELANQRVWAGVHFRSAVVAGRDVGRRVAEYVLANALRPVAAR